MKQTTVNDCKLIDLQKIHDKMVKRVDELLAEKSKEIMTV